MSVLPKKNAKLLLCAVLTLSINCVMGMQKEYSELEQENKRLLDENSLIKESIQFLRNENKTLKQKLELAQETINDYEKKVQQSSRSSTQSYQELNNFKQLQESKLRQVKEENTKLREELKLLKNTPVSSPTQQKQQMAVTPWYYRKGYLGALGAGLLGLGYYFGGRYKNNKDTERKDFE